MPLLTLTSDIGIQDYFVSAMKAVMYQRCPDFKLLDISHEIPPFDLPQTAYLINNVSPHFPEGSYHLILVDLFVSSEQPWIFCESGGQYFLSSNNGIIPMILRSNQIKAFEIEGNKKMNIMGIFNRFLDTILALEAGQAPKEVGEPVKELLIHRSLMPNVQETYLEGRVIFIDRYENVIINITRAEFEEARRGRSFKIYVMRDEFISQIHNNYAEVPEGRKVAFFNTAGYLEIAINKGNAAGLFGLQKYSPAKGNIHPGAHNNLYYETIRIYFE